MYGMIQNDYRLGTASLLDYVGVFYPKDHTLPSPQLTSLHFSVLFEDQFMSFKRLRVDIAAAKHMFTFMLLISWTEPYVVRLF